MVDWQDISSAPRDGSEILVWYDGKRLIARWSSVWHISNMMWVSDIPLSNPPTVEALGPELDTEGKLATFGRAGPTKWAPLLPTPKAPYCTPIMAREREDDGTH